MNHAYLGEEQVDILMDYGKQAFDKLMFYHPNNVLNHVLQSQNFKSKKKPHHHWGFYKCEDQR